MNYSKLLDKYVGKKIKILRENQYQDISKIVEATLLSNNGNQPIYEIGDEIYLGYGGLTILPEIPDNLIAKPTLTWTYENRASQMHDIEVSYLTRNVSWKADYILVIDALDKNGDLSGWVTLNNKSGTTYNDATLKLVAGEIHRVTPQNQYM